jgi:phospholipase/lecithinase/hemolysin
MEPMHNFIFRFLNTIGILSAFFITQPALAAAPFTEIIAFGDSLTDVGNVAGLTVPGVSPVIFGYYQETHFSDNIIWVETLANYWGLPARTPGRTSTTLPPNPTGNTWAWGGSEAAAGTVQPQGVIEPIPNLLAEINEYILSNTLNPNSLYTIWSGADNLLVGGNFGPIAAKKAVKAVKAAMQRLDLAGARHILVFNMPQLGDTPSAQAGGDISIFLADLYTHFYNKDLRRTLKKLAKNKHFHANIYFVDIFSEILKVVTIVNRGGTYVPSFFVPGPPVAINNVKDEGLTFFQNTGYFPPNYLFWDDVHPTTQGHQVVAGLVLKSLKPLID